MIKRYLYPEIEEIWSEENKLKKWLLVEITVLEVQVQMKIIPEIALKIKEDLKNLDYKWLLKRQSEIEKEVEHDVIAFLMALEEISEYAKYLHYGLTSSDIIDTSNSLIIREALNLIKKEYEDFIEVLKEKAIKYKYTPIMGRTHGVYAEPTTVGLKFLNYYSEALRNLKRLEDSINEISYGKISGAVGNFAYLSPKIEELVMEKLNLKPEKVSTQIIPRDRYAYVINNLVLLAESIERIALEIRLLMRTEVGEFLEPFYEKQRGSSAMPHKRNPIRSERICGLVRLIRGYLIPIHENIALWHERDISHSSIERIILPDITSAVYYIIKLSKDIIKNLIIDENRIKENMEKFGKYYITQPFLLKLVQKGISRKIAYEWLKKLSHLEGKNFENAIIKDSEIKNYLSEEEIMECLNWNYFKNVDEIYNRFWFLEDIKIEQIKLLIEKALRELIKNDGDLIRRDLKEECINHKLACYLEKFLNELLPNHIYSVDVEYNRNHDNPKRIPDKERGEKLIIPDIIIHKRESNEFNLIAIEAKKKPTRNELQRDKERIKGLIKYYNYKYGCLILYLPREDYIRVILLSNYNREIKKDEFRIYKI